jgi:lysophospholipase L1-like esterase
MAGLGSICHSEQGYGGVAIPGVDEGMTRPCYVALGDSMSIDIYPQLDLQGRGRIGMGDAPGLGAASLFHRNLTDVWPDFDGRDLESREPGIEKLDLCVDGATIGHTAGFQLPRVPPRAAEWARVVTITAGGNDLLAGVYDGLDGLPRALRDAIQRYHELVGAVAERFPSATLILTTVYDPTDGTGELPGVSEQLGALPVELMETFNDAVRDLARDTPGARLADAHRHFLGHGLTAPAAERWSWDVSPIEPAARGASEIRRLWLEALE